MTLRTNARIAGFTFVLYVVAGISQLMLASRGPANDLLTMVTAFSALVLGVTLYAITRERGSRPRDAGPGLSRHRSRPRRGGDVFRRRQPDFLVAAPPRPDDSRRDWPGSA